MGTNDLAQLGLFAESAVERATRLDALTSDEAIKRRIDLSLAAIDRVMEDGHACQASASGGKDSSIVVSLTLQAALSRADRGLSVPELHIVSVDTLIEQPEVVHLRKSLLARAEAFGREHGLPVFTRVVAPRLTESWWPRIIGGRKLPSYPGSQSDCSVDMKLRPLTRYVKELDADLHGRGLPPAVTLLGTRFAESATRGTNMRTRGESAAGKQLVAGATGRRWVLSPIADWTDEQVFAFLQNVGQGRRYPSFMPDFKETLRVYADSAGAGCMIDVDPTQKNRGKGCGSRHGCTQCAKVDEDHSMRGLLLLPEYAYLRGVADLRNYLAAIRWDFSKRNWVSRSIDPATGDVRLFPNNFSAAECERLLRMVLTIDARERRRANRVREQLEAGSLDDSDYNRRMAEPQFRNLSPEMVIAIDFHWSTAKLFPPFWAWRVVEDVLSGNEMDVPTIPNVQRPAQLPTPRFVRGDSSVYRRLTGSVDATRELAGGDVCGSLIVDDEAMTVDSDAASLFVQLELDRVLEEYADSSVHTPQASAMYYLRMGIVAYPRGQQHFVDRAMRQGQYLELMGLVGVTAPQQIDASRIYVPEATAADTVVARRDLV